LLRCMYVVSFACIYVRMQMCLPRLVTVPVFSWPADYH
jgi:hypothetical protein